MKKTLGLLSVRNADLPSEMDSLAEAVALVLERRLLASADLAILERERLARVNQERALPK